MLLRGLTADTACLGILLSFQDTPSLARASFSFLSAFAKISFVNFMSSPSEEESESINFLT